MKKTIFIAAAIAVTYAIVFFAGFAHAQYGPRYTVPYEMNYQGRLTTPGGEDLDTTVAMTFTIYDAESGGTVLWTETQDMVAVTSGIFNVVLGSVNPLPDSGFQHTHDTGWQDRWLGVQVGSDPEMTPRQRLISVAYALQAGMWAGQHSWDYTLPAHDHDADYVSTTGPDTITGSSVSGACILKVTNSGDGFGLWGDTSSDSSAGVHGSSVGTYSSGVSGYVTGEYSRGVIGHSTGTFGAGVLGFAEGSSGYGVLSQATGTNGIGVRAKGTAFDFYGWNSEGKSYFAGKVGIGTDSPGYKLDVAGAAYATSDSLGVKGEATGVGYGVYGINSTTGDYGCLGVKGATPGQVYGVYGVSSSTSGSGVFGYAYGSNSVGVAAYGYGEGWDFYAHNSEGKSYFAGKVGIGTTDPFSPLHVKTSSWGQARFEHDSDYARIQLDGSATTGADIIYQKDGTATWGIINTGDDIGFYEDDNITLPRLVVREGGNVGVGTWPSVDYRLDVAGSAHASSFLTSSDARLKKNVAQLTNALEKLEKIRGVSFQWNELYESLGRSTGHREIGVIAQEVEAVFPELVTTWGDEEYRAVDYGRLTGVLIEAVKELKAENEALKQRIELLEMSRQE